MGVEMCNWALCKTPNCLTSNTNSVLWLLVVCEGGCTQLTRKKEETSSFLTFLCPPTARRPDLSAIDKTKSNLCGHPFSPVFQPFCCAIKEEIWLFDYNWDSQSLLTHVEQQITLLHSLPSRGFSSDWMVTWYCPICCHDGGLKTGRTRQ